MGERMRVFLFFFFLFFSEEHSGDARWLGTEGRGEVRPEAFPRTCNPTARSHLPLPAVGNEDVGAFRS
jgi:hypothetical protein